MISSYSAACPGGLYFIKMAELKRKFKGIWIPSEVWLDTEMSVTEKCVLAEIDSLDNEKGCFASNQHFANIFRLQPRQIQNIIKALRDKDFVTLQMVGRNKRILRVNAKNYVQRTQSITLSERNGLHHSNTVRDTIRNTAQADASASLKDLGNGKSEEPMDCPQFYTWTKLSKQKHIKIIGEWADTIKPDLRTRAQWGAFIKRNLRAARMLEAFSEDQLSVGFEKIEEANRKGWLKKYTLETLLKFVV